MSIEGQEEVVLETTRQCVSIIFNAVNDCDAVQGCDKDFMVVSAMTSLAVWLIMGVANAHGEQRDAVANNLFALLTRGLAEALATFTAPVGERRFETEETKQ